MIGAAWAAERGWRGASWALWTMVTLADQSQGIEHERLAEWEGVAVAASGHGDCAGAGWRAAFRPGPAGRADPRPGRYHLHRHKPQRFRAWLAPSGDHQRERRRWR